MPSPAARPVDVSVVIPTYNRRELLLQCLHSLGRQSLGRDRFEVVVASDGSTDGTPAAARAAGAELGLHLVVVEARRGGPGHARNRGLAEARGTVIAFTDDDVEHEPGWLAAGLAGFADDKVGGVEGRTEPVMGDESLFRFNLENRDGGNYPTCNMFYLRQALDRAGGFDTRFRRVREDTDLALRVMAAGFRIGFAPDAVVYHRAHHTRPDVPFQVAAETLDSFYLCAKHPDRREFRPRPYPGDLVKAALAVAAPALALTGLLVPAGLAVLGYAALVMRTMRREVRFRAALRAGKLMALAGVYTALPFVSLYYGALGWLRLKRGLLPSEPV